jgi:hypothetical protein
MVGAVTRRLDVRRIILTASGGPFRRWTCEQMETLQWLMPWRIPPGKWARKSRRLGHDDEQGAGNHRGPLAV